MTLNLILGRVSYDKNDFLIKEISEKVKSDPLGDPIIYITPEQMTFEQEKALFLEEIEGSVRAQILSFSRLAWHVLQETGGAKKQFISSIGAQMMLRKIIDEKETPFLAFDKAIDKQGFIEELEGVMIEFKRHLITPLSLTEQVTHLKQMNASPALIHKLTDLNYVYDAFHSRLQDHYIDGEDQLQMLADQLKDAYLLKNAEIYINGFYRFTPKEQLIIERLLMHAKSVTIALTLDEEPHVLDELDLFYQTKETYNHLVDLAVSMNLKVNKQHLSEDSSYIKNPYLRHLETYFDTRPAPQKIIGEDFPIERAEAVHARAEVEGVAQKIRELIRTRHYQYKDIVIYMRDPATYHSLIETIFTDYDLPVFIDEKAQMLNHPLIELIRSFLDSVESNWRHEDLFRLLKTGFIPSTDETYPLTSDAIDVLENYCLEYGIRYKKQWTNDEKWIVQRFRGFNHSVQTDSEKELQVRINRYRDQVLDGLLTIDQQIRQVKTVREKAGLIFDLLINLDIPAKLEKKRFKLDEQGELEKGREQEQVWQALMQLLDEFVEMLGDDLISQKTFRTIFEAGLESLEFSHVPPSLDHIIVATIDQSRINHKKAAFLLGVNEGAWPQAPGSDGMLKEEERELLKVNGLVLAESSRRQLLDDSFYMHIAFSTATEYLWVSYPISDEGRTKMPSPMIRRLEEMFAPLKKPYLLQDPDELFDAKRFISTPRTTRAPLTSQLAKNLRGDEIDPVWKSVLNWYIKNEKEESATQKVLASLFYQNQPSKLSSQSVKALYPETINTSISRLESYHRCKYQHFLRYDLKLEARKTYTFEAPDMGQLFHEALKLITEWIHLEGKTFKEVTRDQANQYAHKSIKKLSPILEHQILSSSERYKYIQLKLEEIIAQATFILSEQARLTEFSPVGIELSFGMGRGLDPLEIELPNGYKLFLKGQIDRVDQARKQDQLYLRIIDYKSSARALDFTEVYYGLALQMLTYLDVVLSQSKNWLGEQAKAAGVLYFHIHNPYINEPKDLSEKTIEGELFKAYKMKGILLAEPDVVSLMDTSLESGTSQIVPAGLKRDGEFYSNSHIANESEINELRHYMHHLIRQSGLKMTTGEIDLDPYEDGQMSACTFCDFKSVCQFDPELDKNNYRKLVKLKDEEVIKKISEINEKGAF